MAAMCAFRPTFGLSMATVIKFANCILQNFCWSGESLMGYPPYLKGGTRGAPAYLASPLAPKADCRSGAE